MNRYNDLFVLVDAQQGRLTRFQAGGSKPLITHMAEVPTGGPVSFTTDVVESFRVAPPEELRARQPEPETAAEEISEKMPEPA